jgi:lipopolysaccharide transport system permease protein
MDRPAEGVSAPVSRPDRAQTPHLVIVPGSTPLFQYLRDLLHHRDLVWVLAVRDLKLRYRQTALGVSWVVLQPVLAAGILSFIFGNVADLPTEGIPTFVFTFAGMLAWTTFSQTFQRATSSLVSSASLVAKIFFPRLVLPISTVFSIMVDFCVTLVIMLVLLFTNDLPPDARILLLPVWLIILIMIAEGAGSFLATFAVRYRDIPHITPVLIQLGLYASPVAYSVSAIPDRYLTLYYLNPIVALLEAFRWSLLGTAFPTTGHLAYSIAVALTVFVVGMVTLERRERTFADVI